MKKDIKNKGFSLMEVIVSVAIITTGLVGLIGLVSFSISGIKPGKAKIIAVALAQEGVEIIRNIRDNNWLSYKNWKTNLEEGTYRVQYNQLTPFSYADKPLKIDNGFYQYDSGSNTPFTRTITIEYIAYNQIKVISQVDWQEKGKDNTIIFENWLYNWY